MNKTCIILLTTLFGCGPAFTVETQTIELKTDASPLGSPLVDDASNALDTASDTDASVQHDSSSEPIEAATVEAATVEASIACPVACSQGVCRDGSCGCLSDDECALTSGFSCKAGHCCSTIGLCL
jgi:hypothetical protein